VKFINISNGKQNDLTRFSQTGSLADLELSKIQLQLYLSLGTIKTRKHSESADLQQTAILNFVEHRISCQSYFCRIAKFGEDFLNHDEQLRFEDFQYGGFDLEL